MFTWRQSVRVNPCNLKVATLGGNANGSANGREIKFVLGTLNSSDKNLPVVINANGSVVINSITIRTVTQRHAQQDKRLLSGRAAVYDTACQTHPPRWSKQCRNWRRIDQVYLNPDTLQTKKLETLKKAA